MLLVLPTFMKSCAVLGLNLELALPVLDYLSTACYFKFTSKWGQATPGNSLKRYQPCSIIMLLVLAHESFVFLSILELKVRIISKRSLSIMINQLSVPHEM